MDTGGHGGKTAANRTGDGRGRGRSIWKGPAFITAIILLAPLMRSLVIDGWDWDVRGALLVGAVGALLFGTGLTYQMVVRKMATTTYRAAVAVALVTAFLLVWLNLVQAGDDVNPAAVVYFGVPLVGIIGAAFARFQPDGMARALFSTAIAQSMALATALIVRNPQATPWTSAVLRGFGLNALFVVLFAGSALLFRKAGLAEPAPGAG